MSETVERLPWVGPHTVRLVEGWAAGTLSRPDQLAWELPTGEPGAGRWFTVWSSHHNSRYVYPTREQAEARAASLRSRAALPESITVAYVRNEGTASYTVPAPGGVS
jgi:hypothetical protein